MSCVVGVSRAIVGGGGSGAGVVSEFHFDKGDGLGAVVVTASGWHVSAVPKRTITVPTGQNLLIVVSGVTYMYPATTSEYLSGLMGVGQDVTEAKGVLVASGTVLTERTNVSLRFDDIKYREWGIMHRQGILVAGDGVSHTYVPIGARGQTNNNMQFQNSSNHNWTCEYWLFGS